MPFISEAASAIKGRFGFHDHHHSSVENSAAAMPSVKSSPDLLFKSAFKDSVGNHPSSSAIRSVVRDRVEDFDEGTVSQSVFEFRDDPSFWKDHNVQVVIRIRPLSSAEISVQGSSKCVRQESSQTVTWTGPPESRFTFDHVADEHVSQEMLFKVAGLPMVENCMGGYNSCMFAYGQTGSGKTHTMLGDIDGGTRRHSVNSGMTPRVFELLFSRIQKDREARRDEKLRFTCKCSFLEIYNEQILDLLDPSSSNLQIREDTKKGVYVDNLTEVEVTNARDVIQQLVQGSSNRKVAATNMNRASSRSHSVFTCIIESKWESQGVTHHRSSRLNLVDLAGSERQKSSGAEGERLKEATNINKSLSTLGLVIMNLVNVSNGRSLHVPYRDSKLTFLLQDSLGGNSKTTIIANISPSSCCSLETLSTLKFAQRAKFIKNHATVNEDASGDVLAMRMQIQELKKEVSRLQSMANGGTQAHDSDAWSLSFPGSPGTFKWEGLNGSFNSPLTSSKRTSQNKEYDVVLVSALRREKDKDIALQALTAENQAAMQLAKQREAEIQGLKMRLRFREAAIKRLEGVASGKISAEAHLLKEKEEHLKEIEVLCTQVDRNQEVTRFAMENLRLKEEIRRLKSFAEEGERERMNEQISVLQNKLLEALDWKLMHEPDPSVVQNNNFELALDMKGDGDYSKEPQTDTMRNVGLTDQIELQTMVDAIAVASQREAESHETAIILSKENDDLRMKLRGLIEDNNRLIDLYEQAVTERNNEKIREAENAQNVTQDHSTQLAELTQEKKMEMKLEVENLEHQLVEMHEENEKLLGLYEKAMQERDEFKRMFSSGKKNNIDDGVFDHVDEKLVEVDGGEPFMSDDALIPGNEILEEAELIEVQVQDAYSTCSTPRTCDYMDLDDSTSASETKKNVISESNKQDGNIVKSENIAAGNSSNDLTLVRFKLDKAQEMLLSSSQNIGVLGSLEKANAKIDKLMREIEALNDSAQVKRKECESYKLVSSELQEKRNLLEKKLMAIKYSVSNFSSSIDYFEQREIQARARSKASSAKLTQNQEFLTHLKATKSGYENAQMKMRISEAELKKYIAELAVKVEQENKRREDDKVLLSIDNVNKTEIQTTFPRKATDLLRSEEEKTKIQSEIKMAREKLGKTRKDIDHLTLKLEKVNTDMQVAEAEIEKGLKSVEEMEQKLQCIIQERRAVVEMEENGRTEFENLLLDYQECLFEGELKEEERRVLEEELQVEIERVEELQIEKAMAMENKSRLLEVTMDIGSGFVTEKVQEELQNVRLSFLELKSLLGEDGSNNGMGLVNVV